MLGMLYDMTCHDVYDRVMMLECIYEDVCNLLMMPDYVAEM